MEKPGDTGSGKEPTLSKCRTLRLVDGFCECIGNKTGCRYALPVGAKRCLCMHKENYSFRVQYLNEAPDKK